MYPALLATVANIAPHIKNLSASASSKLLQLFASMSTPSFLLANDSNHTLLGSLLESMNAIIEHQYSENLQFIYAILRSSKRFEALRNFTLESGQEEIDHRNRLKKDRGGGGITDSPKVSFDNVPETPSSTTPLTPVEESTPFAIGDDEETDEEGKEEEKKESRKESKPVKNETAPPLATSPISVTPPSSQPLSSPVEDAVPHQLRGMSEKARGKMPERQSSTISLSSQNSTSGTHTPTGRFVPTHAWVRIPINHLSQRLYLNSIGFIINTF